MRFYKTMLTLDVIAELVQTSAPLFQKLKNTYTLLPTTQCRRKAHCCSLLPGTTLIEALAVIRCLADMTSDKRERLVHNIIRYFFINPIEITSCPFLEDDACLIYTDRFFGCRAYGLWSRTYYEKMTGQDRKAKVHLQQQWIKLGVSLPQQVINFQIPYCRSVETEAGRFADDKILLQVSDKIEKLSNRLAHRHQSFQQQHFSDLSFLFSAAALGFSEAIRMKFTVVRDIINTGNYNRLEQIIKELPDLLAELVVRNAG